MIDLTPNISGTPNGHPSPRNGRPMPTGSTNGFARIPVIAHLVWDDREELVPAIATGWTDQLVHVVWDGYADWLPVDDVRRVIELPAPGCADGRPDLASPDD